MLVLALRWRTSEMSEESISRKYYVSLSALSGIFCRVGDGVLPPPEALELPILLPAHPLEKFAPNFTKGITMESQWAVSGSEDA
jgi:hypothetical protein